MAHASYWDSLEKSHRHWGYLRAIITSRRYGHQRLARKQRSKRFLERLHKRGNSFRASLPPKPLSRLSQIELRIRKNKTHPSQQPRRCTRTRTEKQATSLMYDINFKPIFGYFTFMNFDWLIIDCGIMSQWLIDCMIKKVKSFLFIGIKHE